MVQLILITLIYLIHNMKIILTESQLKTVINEKLTDDQKKNALVVAKELAPNFSSVRQFSLENPELYNYLRVNNLLDDVFSDRKKHRPDGYWTPETVGQEAQKYSGRKEFHKKNQVAYNKAKDFGILDALFGPMKAGARKTITLDVAIEKARNFEGMRSQFYKKHPTAYLILKDEGLLDRFFQLGTGLKRKYDYDSLINDAKQYENIDDLKANNHELYKKLTVLKLMDDVFPDRKEFKFNKYIEQAKQYKNSKDLRTNNIGLYNNLMNNNLLDIAFPNRKQEKLNGYLEKAKEYGTSTELMKTNFSLYQTLKNNNLLDVAFPDRVKKKLDSYVSKAKQYGTLRELRKLNPALYLTLKNNNLFKSVFPEVIQKDKVDLGIREQKKLQAHIRHAKIYGSLMNLKKQNIGLFNTLKEYGVLDNVFNDAV
jgi:hypothetical protein